MTGLIDSPSRQYRKHGTQNIGGEMSLGKDVVLKNHDEMHQPNQQKCGDGELSRYVQTASNLQKNKEGHQ